MHLVSETARCEFDCSLLIVFCPFIVRVESPFPLLKMLAALRCVESDAQTFSRITFRFVIKAPPAPPRKDRELGNVIISEAKDTSLAKHQVSNLCVTPGIATLRFTRYCVITAISCVRNAAFHALDNLLLKLIDARVRGIAPESRRSVIELHAFRRKDARIGWNLLVIFRCETRLTTQESFVCNELSFFRGLDESARLGIET
jgi:hypothetical protein